MFRSVPGRSINAAVVDQEGNWYASDEVGQVVMSWDAEGMLRWEHGAHFRYPRGLGLGRIVQDGRMMHVLAVADSWNRRVEFLTLDGDPAATWISAGETSFGEVCDVRFFPRQSYWLVLDRTNHCLNTLTMDGTPVSRIGRGSPPSLQRTWAATRVFFREDPFTPPPESEFPPCDFLYYPDRILGDDLDRVFISEPLTSSLKALVPPFLVPIDSAFESPAEWLAADSSGFLGWQPDAGRLVRTDCSGKVIRVTDLEGGRPIPGRSTTQYWIQRDDRLVRIQEDGAGPDQGRGFMAVSAQADLSHFDLWKFCESVTNGVLLTGEEHALAYYIREAGGALDDMTLVKHAATSIPLVQARRSERLESMARALHPWCLALLKSRLSAAPFEAPDDLRKHVPGVNRGFREQIRFRLNQIEDCIRSLSENAVTPSDAMKQSPEKAAVWGEAAEHASAAMQDLRNWIFTWSGMA